MISRLFFTLAMIFSLTEIIVLLSYNKYNHFSGFGYITKWFNQSYQKSDYFNDSSGRQSDEKIKQRVNILSSKINLYKVEQEYDLPRGLLHAVMHQESAGNLDAISKAGAVGPFQFMYYTAKDYGLITSRGDDNRRNPQKSAIAAARYYRKLLSSFGDLNKAIASYNAGEGRVSKANGDMKKLPNETRNYVKRVNYLMKFYQNNHENRG